MLSGREAPGRDRASRVFRASTPPWGAIDQILSAGTNSLVVIAGARALEAEEFGRFSVAMSVSMIAIILARPWTSLPLTIRYSSEAFDHRLEQSARSVVGAVRLGAAAAVVCWIVATGAGLGQNVAAVMGAGLIVLVVQDLLRYTCFVVGPAWGAALSDGVWFAVVAVGLFRPQSLEGAAGLLVLWTVGALLAGVVSMFQMRLWSPSLRVIRSRARWLRQHLGDSSSLMADAILVTAYGYSIPLLLAAITNVDQAGEYRLAQTIAGPALIIIVGSSSQLLPRLVRASGDRSVLFSAARRAALRYGAIAASYTLIIVLLPEAIGVWVFGDAWTASHATAALLGLSSVATGLTVGALLTLRSVGAVRRQAAVRLGLFPVQLAFVLAGTWRDGAFGAAAGLLVGNCLALPVWWLTAESVDHRWEAPTLM